MSMEIASLKYSVASFAPSETSFALLRSYAILLHRLHSADVFFSVVVRDSNRQANKDICFDNMSGLFFSGRSWDQKCEGFDQEDCHQLYSCISCTGGKRFIVENIMGYYHTQCMLC